MFLRKPKTTNIFTFKNSQENKQTKLITKIISKTLNNSPNKSSLDKHNLQIKRERERNRENDCNLGNVEGKFSF